MASNSQKTPLARALLKIGEKSAAQAVELLGRALPCSVTAVMGSIVTVNFELTNIPFTIPQTTMALAGPEYIRYPIQVGCKGVAFPADASLGGMNGLGVGTADLRKPGNLGALTFFPIGNKGWTAPESATQLELYGPDGVLLKNTAKDFYIQITGSLVTISNKAGTVVATNDGTKWDFKGPVTFEGPVTMDASLAILGGVTGNGGSINFGSTNLTTTGTMQASQVTAGSTTLTGHHHLAPSGGGNTGPALP